MSSGVFALLVALVGLFGGGGGILLFRATASKIRADAWSSNETARRTNEEREGIAVVNADKVVGLMNQQIERFEKQITRMNAEADRAQEIRARDEAAIEALKALLIKEQEICALRIDALEREIELLKRQVEQNRAAITANAIVAAAQVAAAVATPVEQTINVRDITPHNNP